MTQYQKALKLLFFAACFVISAEAAGANTLKGKIELYTKQGVKKEDGSNVVVFLEMPQQDEVYLPASINPVLHQKGKRFLPEVLPVVSGTTVDFPNDDNVFHNVFSLSKAKPFDLGIYKQGASKSVTFNNPGLVKVYCNIHPNMVSYILVLNNPYFNLTDKEGNFMITGIPEGAYTVRAWQRFGPEAQTTVSFAGNKEEAAIILRLTEEKVSITHKNKWGGEYKSKY